MGHLRRHWGPAQEGWQRSQWVPAQCPTLALHEMKERVNVRDCDVRPRLTVTLWDRGTGRDKGKDRAVDFWVVGAGFGRVLPVVVTGQQHC